MSNQTTQPCKQCNIEKPLSEFHRRRNGYHKTCKQCRNMTEANRYQAQGKQALPRTTSPINTSNFPALETRILDLEQRLHAKARAFANDNLDADDIYGAMVEAILTKSSPDESDAYILQRANWTAQEYIAKTLTYSQYVENLDVDEGEAEMGGFTIITNPRAIEDAIIEHDEHQNIAALIADLPEENRKIVAMLSVGYKQREIAKELKVTEQSVSERLKTIRATLTFQLA